MLFVVNDLKPTCDICLKYDRVGVGLINKNVTKKKQ